MGKINTFHVLTCLATNVTFKIFGGNQHIMQENMSYDERHVMRDCIRKKNPGGLFSFQPPQIRIL